MLKVVGASWLQTRISTYILVAVALLGIGAIIFSEFGGVNNDGTYSATVMWNHNKIYRIDFWGQGNDLESLPKGAARAYYKTRIHETGWSVVEIETSPTYPDAVQAYAAGMLEGSLTWQLIHHHWYNTIGSVCVGDLESTCDTIRQLLLDNSEVFKSKARLLDAEDPFWHMVHLFYVQLEGLEEGWRFAVKRSRKSFDIPEEDFLWLALASDLPNFGLDNNNNNLNAKILLKNLTDEVSDGLSLALVHNTAAPYRKMLRLLKKYTFGYHETGAKNSKRVATRSISLSSYPGALSSQDEYYTLYREQNKDLMILAGTPLINKFNKSDLDDIKTVETYKRPSDDPKLNIAMTPAMIMAANWLSSDVHTWTRLLTKRKDLERTWKSLQWVIVQADNPSVWLVEQHPMAIRVVEYTDKIREKGYLFCDGNTLLDQENNTELIKATKKLKNQDLESNLNQLTQLEITKLDQKILKIPKIGMEMQEDHEELVLLSNHSRFHSNLFRDLPDLRGAMTFRGDFEAMPMAIGIIDSKISILSNNGLKSFDATCGPAWSKDEEVFQWSKSFPNVPHIGQPDKFNFESITPSWNWF